MSIGTYTCHTCGDLSKPGDRLPFITEDECLGCYHIRIQKMSVRNKVRLLRVIEYTGTAEAINEVMAKRGVKGTHVVGPHLTIREALIGEVGELLDEGEARKDVL